MTRLVICSTIAASVLAAQGGSQQQPPVFRRAADTVPVYVTVVDKSSRLVPNLVRENFQVFDSGKPQPLTQFDNTPQPVRLIVLLDVSTSMYGNLPLLRRACEQLFARLGPDDLARLGTFGKEIDISPVFTHDAAELMASFPQTVSESAPTPLWAAVDKAMSTFGDTPGRRVVLVLSDGKDSLAPLKFGAPLITQLEVIDRAQREDVMVYGVGVFSRMPPGQQQLGVGGMGMASMLSDNLPDPNLGTVALDTGGGYFEIRPRDDLGATFARVMEELHSQYLLGFSAPAKDGKLHKIEVKLQDRSMTARARKNYQASR
jgi:Ca-activated chloride channel homolog